jgi:osmotically inducible protein OsmC
MKRSASAEWLGTLKDGSGTISSQSGALERTPYSFKTRFGDVPGTNPEELLGAAHASCFSMALSNELAKAGLVPESIATTASVTLDQKDEGFAITAIHLDVQGRISGGGDQEFQAAAEKAKAGCPVSKVLKAEITMTATLES